MPDEGLHYCADCHSHCSQTIAAQEQVSELVAALTEARKYVVASVEAEHMIDGFGKRNRLPVDATLERINAALSCAGEK